MLSTMVILTLKQDLTQASTEGPRLNSTSANLSPQKVGGSVVVILSCDFVPHN